MPPSTWSSIGGAVTVASVSVSGIDVLKTTSWVRIDGVAAAPENEKGGTDRGAALVNNSSRECAISA
jgi:hypothetical protein